jgi:antitoxin VapB
MDTAKIFVNGSSQAVRLPKAFRFEGADEVYIERKGDAVILRPLGKPSIEKAIQALSRFEAISPRDQPKKVDRRESF